MAIGRVSDIINLTEAGIDEVFNREVSRPRKLEYKNICREVSGDKKIYKHQSIGNLGPAVTKPEGDTITYRKIEEAYETTIEATTKSNGAAATLEQLEYDLEGVVSAIFGAPLVDTMIVKKEKEVADVYNNAFTATGPDGVAWIANAHPLVNNNLVTNDNLLTGEMSTTTIQTAKNMFNFIYDQAGEFMDTAPTHLLIHPNKLFLALQLLNSQLMALELSNTKNVLQDVAPIKIVTNRWLTYNTSTDVSPWFMLDKTLNAGAVLYQTIPMAMNKHFEWEDLTYKGEVYEAYGCSLVGAGYGLVGSQGS